MRVQTICRDTPLASTEHSWRATPPRVTARVRPYYTRRTRLPGSCIVGTGQPRPGDDEGSPRPRVDALFTFHAMHNPMRSYISTVPRKNLELWPLPQKENTPDLFAQALYRQDSKVLSFSHLQMQHQRVAQLCPGR